MHVVLYNTVYRISARNYKRFLADVRDGKQQPIDSYGVKPVIAYAENISEIDAEQAGWWLDELNQKEGKQ